MLLSAVKSSINSDVPGSLAATHAQTKAELQLHREDYMYLGVMMIYKRLFKKHYTHNIDAVVHDIVFLRLWKISQPNLVQFYKFNVALW